MTVIPMSAVFGDPTNNDKYVWILEDNKVQKRKIEEHSPNGESSLIVKNGLKEGEVIVTAGVTQLVEGETVKVLTD